MGALFYKSNKQVRGCYKSIVCYMLQGAKKALLFLFSSVSLHIAFFLWNAKPFGNHTNTSTTRTPCHCGDDNITTHTPGLFDGCLDGCIDVVSPLKAGLKCVSLEVHRPTCVGGVAGAGQPDSQHSEHNQPHPLTCQASPRRSNSFSQSHQLPSPHTTSHRQLLQLACPGGGREEGWRGGRGEGRVERVVLCTESNSQWPSSHK